MPEEEPDPELAALADEIERLRADIDERPDGDEARELALGLTEAVEALHHEALLRIVRRLRDDDSTFGALQELTSDPAVRLVLVAHGILQLAPDSHVRGAFDPGVETPVPFPVRRR